MKGQLFQDDLDTLSSAGIDPAALRAGLLQGGDVALVGAEGGFAAFLLAAIGRAVGRPLFIVTPDASEARTLHAALSSYDGSEPGEEPAAVLLHAPDVSPYQELSPNRFLTMERLATLYRLHAGLGVRYVVAPATAVARRALPPEVLERATVTVSRGDLIDRDALLGRLVEAGYASAPIVEDPGTFAARGGIVDVYSPIYDQPLRIDLFGDEVEEIRAFDPETQRSGASFERAILPPVSEVLLTPGAIAHARVALRDLADDLVFPTTRVRPLLDDVESGVLTPALVPLLPAFHPRLASVLDMLPADALLVVADPARTLDVLEQQREALSREHEAARRKERLVYPASAHVLGSDEMTTLLERRPRVRLLPFVVGEESAPVHRVHPSSNADIADELARVRGQDHALAPLADRIRAWRSEGQAVAITCHTIGSAERMQAMLRSYHLTSNLWERSLRIDDLTALRLAPNDVNLFTVSSGQGFRYPPLAIVVLDESEILGAKQPGARPRRPASVLPQALIASFQELEPGDFVVHTDHGIARYEGMKRLDIDGLPNDFLLLVYKDEHKLYLPVQRLNRISRYVGADGTSPALDKLGGVSWERTKQRVRRELFDMAGELIKIYAEREAREGYAFSKPDEYYREFEASFPFEETPDQDKAIVDVLSDMQRTRPMDRLVCGDVGYGKTEVAIRAALKAVLDGKQVAVLVPTTVLAEQHMLTFEKRYEGYPVVVESVSRFKSSAEQREVLARAATGRVDVLIGTHRLLQKDVKWKDLGLLVVDEEHRFGVRHKERLKQLRATVDVLTLTATPIPRTLQMSLLGIRDLSVIATPPRDRLSIRTIVERDTDDVLTDAIRRELQRGGQVYFLHNRVDSIGRRAEHVQRLVPEGRYAIGHGQMHKGELEKVMRRFIAGEVNVLVCTTIIESGLDIPNANTLIVDRADKFGLADLYQLRGRVGRSNVRGYAYLLIPDPARLTGDAGRRIAVLQRYSDLGAGFQIATHDLEIRGAGNLLGAQQHGQIEALGYDLYLEMLEEAVHEIRGEQHEARIDTELRVPLAAYIPETYCPDTGLRLMFYKRLASARDQAEADDVLADLGDRCGRAPEEVRNLAVVARLKLRAERLGIEKLEYAEHGLSLKLHPRGPMTGELLLRFLSRPGARWKMSQAETALVRGVSAAEWASGLGTVHDSLNELANFLESAGALAGL